MEVKFNYSDYKSDSIVNGRRIKNFFEILSNNVFEHARNYYDNHFEITGYYENPLLFKERNLYSIFSSSINKITPVHLSEWGFSKNDENNLDSSRKVDFWCLEKNGTNSKPLNFYIEIKKGYYCLSSRSKQEFVSSVSDDVVELQNQLKTIKNLKPRFSNFDDVYLGVFVVHGYSTKGTTEYDSNDVFDNFFEITDGRTRQDLMMATWKLPQDYKVQWDIEKCEFISIVGIVQK